MEEDSFEEYSDGNHDGEDWKEEGRQTRSSTSRRNAAVARAHEEGVLMSSQDDMPPTKQNDYSLALASSLSPSIISREERVSSIKVEPSSGPSSQVGGQGGDDEEFVEEDMIVGGGGRRSGGGGGSTSSGRKRTRPVPIPGSAERRLENSLGSLTQRFVALVKHAEGGLLDLNSAAGALSVRKRRVYDITNVLEGIGLIEKNTKNVVQWKGSGFSNLDEKEQMEQAKKKHDELVAREAILDAHIAATQHELRLLGEDTLKSNLAYVTYSDICSMPLFRDQAVLAIKAPPHTHLEVPDPDAGIAEGVRRYQLHLKSSEGNAIFAYLLTSDTMADGGLYSESSVVVNNATQDASLNDPSSSSSSSVVPMDTGKDDFVTGSLFHQDHSGALHAALEPSNYTLPALSAVEGVYELFVSDEK